MGGAWRDKNSLLPARRRCAGSRLGNSAFSQDWSNPLSGERNDTLPPT